MRLACAVSFIISVLRLCSLLVEKYDSMQYFLLHFFFSGITMRVLHEFLCLLPFLSDCCSVILGSVVLGPYHHLDSFEGLPVVGGVVLRRHVVPRSPEDPIPDPFVPFVVVLPVQVGRHAGVEPPAGAVVGTAVSGGVHVVVAVGRGEELLVVVEVLVEVEGVPGGSAAMTPV